MTDIPGMLTDEQDAPSPARLFDSDGQQSGEAASAASPDSAAAESYVLELRGVVKRFGGAVALSGVDFALRRGAIHGLLGENGAGKSTLMKILSGVHAPDEGEIILEGKPVKFHSPAAAKALGIGMIYQELTTVPTLTVAENVFLGRQY